MVEIIAHRGASSEAPENTRAAVELAWTQGADAVEVDVQLSRDDELVVFHDENTRRIAGLDKKVCEQTLADLQRLDAGRWKGARWRGERIPTLEEVLSTVPAGKRLFVEIKSGAECLPVFGRALKRSGKKPEQAVLIGFSLETMEMAKRAFPRLEIGWVATFERNWRGAWTPEPERLVARAKASGLDSVDLSARGPWTPKLGRIVHEAGLKLYVWTVDSMPKARQVMQGGVEGITTNRPGWLRQRLTLP